MASTYSPKLRFELIGAGEQAGLWGSTTNKNVGQLIEQAIAGVTTVELDGLSGNYTLTALDGAPDQSRSAVIKCIQTAAPAAGAINLIIPTQTKLYVVRNDCGQTVTVKTSAQVGGVVILNGESTLVFCDGSEAQAGIETAAVGTLTVSGGGTGSTTFTAGFVKSPGGTGALTSSATVALGSEVSGTLPVANGGTGLSSTTAYGVITGGTTSTGNFQNAGAGTSGQVLTSNGASALPTWQTPASAFSAGMILLWSGTIATIPSGWALCNGSNGTPDLRDRFIVGAGSTYAVNATGGSATTTLSTANLPSHNHTQSASGSTDTVNLDHTHSVSGTTGTGGGSHTHTASVTDSGHSHVYPGTSTNYNNTTGSQTNQAWRSPDTGTTSTQSATTGISVSNSSTNIDHTHSFSATSGNMSANTTHSHSFSLSGNTGSTGSGTAFDNLPPYYALAYIMKL
jgi:microcystin-dependent protein